MNQLNSVHSIPPKDPVPIIHHPCSMTVPWLAPWPWLGQAMGLSRFPHGFSKAQHATHGFHDAKGCAALVLRHQVTDHGLADGHHHLGPAATGDRRPGPATGHDRLR